MVSTCLKALLPVFIPPDTFDGRKDQILTALHKVGVTVRSKTHRV